MKNFEKGLVILLLLIPKVLLGQEDFKIHSHNDYLREVPFWEAFGAGSASIEVDVILEDGNLVVAHERESIQPKRTLRTLYLEQIHKAVELGMIQDFDFHLLIDSKTEAYTTLEAIVKEASEFEHLLFSAKNPQGLKLIISGNRPKPEDYSKYPEWILFDYQSTSLSSELPWEKIGMVSLSFRQFSVWNGKGRMVEAQKNRLQNFIALVHSFEKPVRFWAAPDGKSAWKAFYDLGIDYINTDRPQEARAYLSGLSRNVYSSNSKSEIYTPSFQGDGVDFPVKNIILMIGDGNGLAQISAGLFANGGRLNLSQLKSIGLVKTQAADDFTTDSAAGATAFSTGKKTNNRAIGIDPEGLILKNLPEILSEYGFSSGILTTDLITGATPASFYAHHKERDEVQEIASYLPESSLDLVIAKGGEALGDQQEKLNSAGFELVGQLDQVSSSSSVKVSYFSEPSRVLNSMEFLSEGVEEATSYLKKKNQPFFLMIESALIDSGGHSNSTATIVEEMIAFDQAIGQMIQFADENPGTLVIITADHETGGVSIPQGNLEKRQVELAFHSDDHTGILVPIFAYGPHSDEFRGIYENTEVFEKITKLVKEYHKW